MTFRTIQIGTCTYAQGRLVSQSNGMAVVEVFGKLHRGRLLPQNWRE